MSQVDKFKKREIETKLKKWKEGTFYFCEIEGGNVAPYDYSVGDSTITLEYVVQAQDDVPERISKTVFNIALIDEKLNLFSSPKHEVAVSKSSAAQSSENTNTEAPPITDTTENKFENLNTFLFSTLSKLEARQIKPDEAKSMAQVAQTLINSAKLQMEYNKLRGKGNTAIPMLE